MEDRSKRTETVRPQVNNENDVELNGETDDEDMEYGDVGFDDGSVQVRNIRDPGQPTVKEHQEHVTTHRPCRSWCKFCVMGRGVFAWHRRSGFLGEGNRKSRCLLCWSSANGDTR